MNRFYIETELNQWQFIELTESVFHHWCFAVLRAKNQDPIFSMGKGEYISDLTEINKKMQHVSD